MAKKEINFKIVESKLPTVSLTVKSVERFLDFLFRYTLCTPTSEQLLTFLAEKPDSLRIVLLGYDDTYYRDRFLRDFTEWVSEDKLDDFMYDGMPKAEKQKFQKIFVQGCKKHKIKTRFNELKF